MKKTIAPTKLESLVHFQIFKRIDKTGFATAIYTSIFTVTLGIVLALLHSQSVMSEDAELQVLRGNGLFTNKLYKVLSKKEGNVFFSPISAHTVLSMAYQGSAGTTLKAFASTLQVPELATTADGYNQVITRLNNIENVTLLTANRVYLAGGKKLQENFKNVIEKKYLSEISQVDFRDAAGTAEKINSWVSEKTKDKIKDLIKPSDLDSLTRLVLVNAIYFKGDWAKQFKKEDTKTQPFYLNDKDTVDVQMMFVRSKYRYRYDDSLKAKILEMPYKNGDVSMVIILPDERNGIKELEAKLENVDLTKITENAWPVEVQLSLPKFKIETTVPLKDTLVEIGLGEIFQEGKADFSGILTPTEDLYVSKVIQKAFIEVNEEGATAAASTGLLIQARTGRVRERIDYKVDHPFTIILKVKNQSQSSILFIGRINSIPPEN